MQEEIIVKKIKLPDNKVASIVTRWDEDDSDKNVISFFITDKKGIIIDDNEISSPWGSNEFTAKMVKDEFNTEFNEWVKEKTGHSIANAKFYHTSKHAARHGKRKRKTKGSSQTNWG